MVKLYAVSGRIVRNVMISGTETSIEVSSIPAGFNITLVRGSNGGKRDVYYYRALIWLLIPRSG